MKLLPLFILSMFCFTSLLFSQSVYEPVTDQVYHFLDRMEAKQIITDYRDVVKPISRETLAKFLIQIDTTSVTLSDVDREQLNYYKEEYYQELQNLGYQNLIEERWHLYNYESDPADINLDLVGGYTYHIRADGKNTRVTSNGLMTYGYVGKNVGAYFYFKDNHEAGTYLDPTRALTPIPAEVPSRNLIPKYFEYTTIEAQVNVDWGFVTLSVEKDHNQWGTGENGTIIFSDKAPSFPQIKRISISHIYTGGSIRVLSIRHVPIIRRDCRIPPVSFEEYMFRNILQPILLKLRRGMVSMYRLENQKSMVGGIPSYYTLFRSCSSRVRNITWETKIILNSSQIWI